MPYSKKRQGKIVLLKLLRSRIVTQFTQRQLVRPTLRRPWCCRVGEGLHRVRHRESQCFCWIWIKWSKSSIFSPQPPDGKPEGLDIFGLAERSYDDEIDFVVRLLNDSCHSWYCSHIIPLAFEKLWKVNSNLGLLMAGFGLLFVYISVVLGNFNWIEQRVCSSFNSAIYYKSGFPFCCRNVGDWTCTWRLFWSLLLHRPLHQWCLSSYTLPTSGNRWILKNHSRP